MSIYSKTKWNLFLDDIRDPSYIKDSEREYKLARSFGEAITLIKDHGLPQHISFDHDLGWDTLLPMKGSILLGAPLPGGEAPSGYDLAKWLVEMDLRGDLDIPKTFTYYVHSSNPVGAQNIYGLLNGYMKSKYG